MEQYVKGFKGFTPVKMCGLSPLASFYLTSIIPRRTSIIRISQLSGLFLWSHL